MATDEVTVEFGLVFGAETGIVVAKGTTEVHFAVTFSWRRPEPASCDSTPPATTSAPDTRAAGSAGL